MTFPLGRREFVQVAGVAVIAAKIPAQVVGNVSIVVTSSGIQSNAFSYTENLTPQLTRLSPANAAPGSTFTINGLNLGVCGTLEMSVGSGMASVNATFNSTSIVATVPAGAVSGPLFALCQGYQTNSLTLRACSRSSEYEDEEGKVNELQAGGRTHSTS